ncbi:MAG TPA: M28 family metallopeptidase [Frankiaceae bacterium]|nr:M28 family metallopeptidase [Frankiaceae bacterium]
MNRSLRSLAVAALAASTLLAPSLAPSAYADPNNNSSEKLRSAVTLQGVRRHQAAFQSIATAAGGNRFAGTPGYDNSAEYVAEQLRAAGYTPTFQEFEYDAFFERTPSQMQQISPNATTYTNGVEFRVLSYSGSGDVTAPLAVPGGDSRGCYAADWSGYSAGTIALVERGTPAGFPGGSCTFRIKLDNARAAGATAILVYNNVPGVVNGTLGATGLSQIPGLGITQALGQSLRAQLASQPTVMRVRTDTGSERLATRNVFAETAGGDPNNVVMTGAHLDSVTAGPGINDNGSGSAAILETAIQMAKVSPRNKVRFAWWSAEESGLIGSTYYIAQLPQAERDKIALYLNFDMVGSPNFARFVYDGDNSTGTGAVGPAGSDVIERVFYGYFESQGLHAEPSPFNGRSDYGPFIAAGIGIPAGGLFTGAEGIKTAAQAAKYGGTAGIAFDPCYHAACDTYDNNSDVALDTNSDAIAHSVITFAQSTELINGVRGKGNFKRPAQGDNDGTGTGGGGGLHDEHEHDEA